MGELRRGRRVREGRAETDMIRREGWREAEGAGDGMGYADGTLSHGGSELLHEGTTEGALGGEGGRSEKSSAAYVGFRARLAATAAAAATALIRVRRYEIIKLGLDGGARRRWREARRGRGKEERKGGTGKTAALDVGGAMGRGRMPARGGGEWGGARDVPGGGGREQEDNRIPYILVYERQPRRPFETPGCYRCRRRCGREPGRSRPLEEKETESKATLAREPKRTRARETNGEQRNERRRKRSE